MLKSKVSKILGDWLPSIKSVTKCSYNHKNCLEEHNENNSKAELFNVAKFKKEIFGDIYSKLDK